jgi:hypothetical protein
VPGDANLAALAITAQLSEAGNTVDRFAGSFAWRLSSPTARFAPLTNLFAVTNFGHLQSFTGTVRSNGTNVPNAFVVLQYAGPGQKNNLAVGAIANNSGSYTVKAAAGTYQLFALRSNYVTDLTTAPVVTLPAGATVVTNLNLIPVTNSISGRIFDLATNSTGLPGMLLFAQPQDRTMATIGFTDSSGNFKLPVTANQWRIKADNGAPLLGYVSVNDLKANSLTGNVVNANIALPRGTALFYGRIRDEQNQPVIGVNFYAEDESTGLYQSQAWSDLAGNYAVAVTPGDWCVGVSTDDQSIAGYVVSSGICTNINAGQAIRADFSARRATNHLTGYVRDQWNNPVPNLQLNANGNINGTDYSAQAQTDATGAYILALANGDWQIGLDCDGDKGLLARAYECVSEVSVQLPPDRVLNFTVPNLRPVLSSPRKTSGTQFQFTLLGQSGRTYILEYSTNLTAWNPLWTTNAPTDSFVLTDSFATNNRRFYRAFFQPGASFSLSFMEFAGGGNFSGGFTPVVAYPVFLDNYSALFGVHDDNNFPQPQDVYFTGPANSGLANTPAASIDSGGSDAEYQSPFVYNPAAAPGGSWNVFYKSVNQAFSITDPQAASRLVIPLPTVSVSGGLVQSVGWVYKNSTTGATLGAAPAFMTRIQLQIDSLSNGRIYDSPWLAPNITSHTLSSSVNWADVSTIYMAYDDSLGNHYVVSFSN